MSIVLKIYGLSCLVVLAFFAFFSVPWGLMPFSDAMNVMVVGGALVGLAAFYTLYFYRKEGLDLGWFLANRGGFWAIATAAVGLVTLACGVLLFFSPEIFLPAFEQGALPFGIAIVSLFWLALIFMCGFLAFGMIARSSASAKLRRFEGAVGHLAIGLFCLALTALFFSLFLEVINDIAIRISVATQWNAIWIFAGALAAISIVEGLRGNAGRFFENEEKEQGE